MILIIIVIIFIFRPFLLECPNRDVRFTMARILDCMMSSYFKHGGIQVNIS